MTAERSNSVNVVAAAGATWDRPRQCWTLPAEVPVGATETWRFNVDSPAHSRTHCIACERKILENDLRVGYPAEDKFSADGVSAGVQAWLAGHVVGFESLAKKKKAMLVQGFCETLPPAVNKSPKKTPAVMESDEQPASCRDDELSKRGSSQDRVNLSYADVCDPATELTPVDRAAGDLLRELTVETPGLPDCGNIGTPLKDRSSKYLGAWRLNSDGPSSANSAAADLADTLWEHPFDLSQATGRRGRDTTASPTGWWQLAPLFSPMDIPASFDLENFLSAESSQLKKPAPGVKWDPTTKNWITEDMQGKLKKKQADALEDWRLETDLAKSGLSTCRRCGHKIPKSSLRFGYPVEDPRGNLGAIIIWFHAECAPFKFLEINGCLEGLVDGDSEAPSEGAVCDPSEWFTENMMGFEGLTDENKESLLEVFRKRHEKKKMEDLDIGGMKQMVSQLLVDKFTPPDELVIPLLAFQREGLAWMCNQELTKECRGGVLADEMGMGKTIQAVALIMKRREETKGPTLVVCPVAAVMQWYSEIHRYLKPDSLKVHVYHGNKRLKGEDLLKFDVVLTTYQTMEYEYRKQLNRLKSICQSTCAGRTPEKTAKQSKTHRKFREAAEAAKKTLGIPTAGGEEASGSPESVGSRSKKKRKAESDYKPPTVGNVLREVMAKAGMENAEKASIWKVKEYYWAKQRAKHEESEERAEIDEASIRRMTMRQLKEVIMDRYPGMEIPNQMRRAELVSLILEMEEDQKKMNGESTEEKVAEEEHKVERLSSTDIGKLKVAELRAKCQEMGLDTSGLKAVLVARVREAVDSERIARMRKTSKAATKDVKASPSSSSTIAPRTAKGSRASPVSLGSSPDSSDVKEGATLSVSESSSSSSDKKRRMSASNKRAVVARLRQTVKPQAGRGPAPSKRAKASADDDYEPSDASASSSSSENESDATDGSSESSDSELEVVKKPTARRMRDEEGEDGDAGDDTSDCERSDLDLSKSALHSVRWGRVILDEAHRIKGRTTTTALGAYALRAEYRWGLSGTPLQNRVGELYSLIRFLKNDPYAFYFCKAKDCDCKSMAYRFEDNRYCKRCGHTKMQHYSYFNQTISKPILKHGFAGVGKDALKELRERVLDRLLLRRTKEERADDLQLPSMTVSIRRTELTDSEKDFYESLAMQSQLRFNVYADEGTVLNNYAHIFDLLTRLRQAVDHPYLIVHGMDCGSIPAKSAAGKDRADICVLCQDDIPARTTNEDEAQAKATCGHSFHNECVRDFLREAPQLPLNGGIGCPACFAPITVTFGQAVDEEEESQQGSPSAEKVKESAPIGGRTRNSILNRIKADEFESSAKIDALLDEIRKMKEKDPAAKGLVFSQFSRMLELVDFKLRREGISCLVLHGGIPMTQRSNILLSFRQDPEFSMLLISLKAGGEGLNLQAASSVFLLDPWWNPAYEQQAIQRAHRLGQTKPVNAVRFITKDTVEERILALQEKEAVGVRWHCPTTIVTGYECNPVHLAAISPDGNHLATAVKTGCSGSRVVVRKLCCQSSGDPVIATIPIPTLTGSSSSGLSALAWSPDSRLLLASHNECGSIVVLSPIDHPDWRCTIEQGSAGLAASLWSPDSRHVLAIADFSLRLDVWSLTTQSSIERIKYAKSPTNHSGPAVVASAVPTVAFSNTCQSLAVIRRRECKDYISIHDPQEGFKQARLSRCRGILGYCPLEVQVSHFGLPTVDAYGVVWPSFKDSQLLVWENPSASSTAFVLLYVYSIAGEQLHAVKPPSGSLQSDTVCLTGLALFPQEGLVAVGTAGGQAHILNASTWSLLASFSHGDPLPVRTTADEGRCFIYRLEDTDGKQARYKVENGAYESFSEDSALTTELSHHSRPIIRQNRGIQGLTGIRKLEWSPSGLYLATRDGKPYTAYCFRQSPTGWVRGEFLN
ncbi:hypothetical protein FOZ60_015775 [Perkinsus olseni]|uniref:DNA repair protein rad16 n=2 Tax=Perkinsus olseni TaxID=32597 RepID=A0A7J6P5G6_PEROL|nr:hypothetical protein FOZ60_015775 [Perkinsus olseni]